MRTLIAAGLVALLSTAAFAQTTPNPANNPNDKLGLEQNPGLGQMDKPKDQIRVEESSILPNAGASSDSQSAAPTMKLDCQKTPSDCSDPVKSTGSTAPGLPVQSK
ncbi:MAG TPA: hypothetical protein VIL09_16065 [Microvirga sp.]|jgi:hypothetical protein